MAVIYLTDAVGVLSGPVTIPEIPGLGLVLPANAVELVELPEPRAGYVWAYQDGQAAELLDARGIYYRTDNGARVQHSELGALPEGLTPDAPPSSYHIWQEGAWALDSEAERQSRVPRSITMRQARRCLRLHGLLDAVQPAIDSLPDPDREDAQIDWDYSATVERDRGFVLQVAQALGLSDQQLDELFIEAATL